METTPPADPNCKCKQDCECELQKIKTQGEVDIQFRHAECHCKREELEALWNFRNKVYNGLGELAGGIIERREKSAIRLLNHTTSTVFDNLRTRYVSLYQELNFPEGPDRATAALEIINSVTKVLQTALQQLPAIVRSGNEAAEAYAQITGPGDGENRGTTQSGSSGSSGSASK